MNKVLVIGAVNSTKLTIEQLVKHGFEITGVLGHEPKDINIVSGWEDLKSIAQSLKVPYKGFRKINDLENIKWAEAKKPDIIFAVGFSQLLSPQWITMAPFGCVGFHPTNLPAGRGRAPLAWLVLEKMQGAATFFLMGEGADSGPIFIQQKFDVTSDDDALSVRDKISQAIVGGLDKWLPDLRSGIWNPMPQDEAKASWYGKRAPQDGIVDWSQPAAFIDRLIKASTKPHPGAYTFYRDSKVVIWKSTLENHLPIKGVVGRILLTDNEKGYLIQCGEGLLWIRELETEPDVKLSVGQKLGYNVENEIFLLRKMIKELGNE